MKLSEAIRLGSVMKRQIVELFSDKDGGVCAQGAALAAVGKLDERGSRCHENFKALWPEFHSMRGNCPVSGCSWCGTCIVIAHLNNDHGWTFNQIADWVESIENQREPQAVDFPEEKVTA